MKEQLCIIEGLDILNSQDPGILTTPPALTYEDNGYVKANCQQELLRFHPEVALYCPQIPQNTGTIARLCAAFSTTLHLIEPMGFEITEKKLKRAGLDYWEYVNIIQHKSFEDFKASRPERRFVFVETGGTQAPSQFNFQAGDVLVFGAETFGIHKHILDEELKNTKNNLITIPMFQRGVRSINLANTVSIVLYQALSHLHVGHS